MEPTYQTMILGSLNHSSLLRLGWEHLATGLSDFCWLRQEREACHLLSVERLSQQLETQIECHHEVKMPQFQPIPLGECG